MKTMKVVVLSGGSGNSSIVSGIVNNVEYADIKVIVNAYDNGKSTGVCRAVTNTLGVSDIRKNHWRMYKLTHQVADERLSEFYTSRYDLSEEPEKLIKDKLEEWDLMEFEPYCVRFFKTPSALSYKYNDFCISNIVYAQMYKELGYEATNKRFCDLLDIDDMVILNSFDNVYLHTTTQSGHKIFDEGELVNWSNSEDKVSAVFYTGEVNHRLNPAAVNLILNADLIIISTGTFWSSIYPTLHYGDLYKYVNSSSAKKVWVMNCTEDKDAIAVSSNEFISKFEELGLDLSKFDILLNSDAPDILCEYNDNYSLYRYHMGREDGKHNAYKVTAAIMRSYYGIHNYNQIDKILFDFDDTLWARDKSLSDISMYNLKFINRYLHDKSIIISGNSWESIKIKLKKTFGTKDKSVKVPIWADASSVKYMNLTEEAVVSKSCILTEDAEILVDKLSGIFKSSNVSFNGHTCIKIKPIATDYRQMVVDYLNNYILPSNGLSYLIAVPTGKTTVDILNKTNDKSNVYDIEGLDGLLTLYIGDEVDLGNDVEIAKKCSNRICVKSVIETNFILSLLLGGVL